MLGRPNCARMRNSRPPWNCLMVHTTASWSGAYAHLPTDDLSLGESALGGTGTTMRTLLAVLRCLNCALAFTMYSTRECACRSTIASIQMSGFTCVLRRYDMSSNSPSGGTNEMVRFVSNLDSLTHWWNVTSSISIEPFFLVSDFCDDCAKRTRSLRPRRSSGMPLSLTLSAMRPTISERSSVPLDATSRLMLSITSRNTSLRLYLMPSGRHDTAPVTAAGTDTSFFVSL
mmetsp:Transcript_29375/g.71506  ORF Transcript_29375/g.71506 Transcript_29375/m.71506 type:complete len:230 (-) Transcript_29375:553-1242(-)